MDTNQERTGITEDAGDDTAPIAQEPLDLSAVIDDIASQEFVGGPAGEKVHAELNRQHGMPFKIIEGTQGRSGIHLNQVRLAAGFAADCPIRFDRKRRYMEFAAATGLWKGIADSQV